jgi:hypothetical protein
MCVLARAHTMDVPSQGMSHRAGAHQDSWHAANPTKPGFASEVRELLVLPKSTLWTAILTSPIWIPVHYYPICCKLIGWRLQAVICFAERGVDADFCPGVDGTQAKLPQAPGACRFNNEVSNCTATQLLPSDSRPFMAGENALIRGDTPTLVSYRQSPLD